MWPLFALVAFAPLGSSYSAIKHFSLAFDSTSNSCSAAVVLVASVSAILAWLMQLRLFPSAFGVSRHRAFASAVHDIFLPVLGLTVSLLLFLLIVPGNGIFDANSVLAFSYCSSLCPVLCFDPLTGLLGNWSSLFWICLSLFSVSSIWSSPAYPPRLSGSPVYG